MKIKTISKLLATTLFLSNINILALASSWSEDGRYETITGDSIEVNNILEDEVANISIEGNTLVNIVKPYFWRWTPGTQPGEVVYTTGNNFARLEFKNANRYTESFVICAGHDFARQLKPNTQYTVFLDVKTNMEYKNRISIRNEDWTSPIINDIDIMFKNGVNKWVFRTPSEINLAADDNQKVYIYLETSNTINGKYFEVANPMILEGDWTNKDAPEYFEGIQSGFENQLVTQEMINSGQEKQKNLGKYKVEVKSTGKNLFNINNIDYSSNKVSISDDKIHMNNVYGIEIGRLSEVANLEVGKTYKGRYSYNVISGDGLNAGAGGQIRLYKREGNNYTSFIFLDTVFTVTEEILDYRVVIYGSTEESEFYDIQIEENTSSTNYQPYKESNLTLYLNSPLLKDDTIEYKDGQLYHVKRSGKTTFDGSEEWECLGTQGAEGKYIRFANSDIDNLINRSILVSNRFLSEIYRDVAQFKKEFIFAHHTDKNRIDVLLESSRLSSLDENGFELWLESNNVDVIYTLINPIYEPINSQADIQLFEDRTYVINNSNVPVNMSITVDRVANRAKEAIEVAKSNPTTENISQARYWINLMKESMLKDEFQSEINTNREIKDLTIEKKTTSANVDMYVKMKNSLSLSLNTNSITFEDFNASEDLEMKNAVNLTVGSSLPYKVTACLESEIYNADKTAVIDKSVLNIKNSGDTSYKAFNDISEPLLLLDNQIEGDNISHSLDLILKGGSTHKADVYRTTIKFEVEQK